MGHFCEVPPDSARTGLASTSAPRQMVQEAGRPVSTADCGCPEGSLPESRSQAPAISFVMASWMGAAQLFVTKHPSVVLCRGTV